MLKLLLKSSWLAFSIPAAEWCDSLQRGTVWPVLTGLLRLLLPGCSSSCETALP